MSCLRSYPRGRNGKTGSSGDMGPFTTSLMCINYSRGGRDESPLAGACCRLPREHGGYCRVYISSSTKAWTASTGIRRPACARGPAVSTGSAPCRVGTSVRSKNFPIGISSSQS
jgi:hypothetical protein